MMTLNHGLSGYVCGQVVLPLVKSRAPLSPRAMGWAAFIGAMLPDLDILTRLFGYDAYFSSAWYAHRHASHSILGALVLGLLATGLWMALRPGSGQGRAVRFFWLAGCFWFGGVLHLVGDLFTPGWPLPVFWPYAVRFGGWAHIGWFSPYLLWLFLSAILLAWGVEQAGHRFGFLRAWRPSLTWSVFALAAFRWGSFMAGSRYHSWEQWLAFHNDLLPEPLIYPVTAGVRFLWFWLTS